MTSNIQRLTDIRDSLSAMVTDAYAMGIQPSVVEGLNSARVYIDEVLKKINSHLTFANSEASW